MGTAFSKPGWPTRGTRATSGTRMLSKWHAQKHYIHTVKRDSQEFTIFWKYLPPSQFPALRDMALRYYCRFGSTYIREKKIRFHHERGKK